MHTQGFGRRPVRRGSVQYKGTYICTHIQYVYRHIQKRLCYKGERYANSGG